MTSSEILAAVVGAVVGAAATGLVRLWIERSRELRRLKRQEEEKKGRLVVHLRMVRDRCRALLPLDEDADGSWRSKEQPHPSPATDSGARLHAGVMETLQPMLQIPYLAEERWLEDAEHRRHREQLADLTEELREALAQAFRFRNGGDELDVDSSQDATIRHLDEAIEISTGLLDEVDERYFAFLSYTQADATSARRIQRLIERYRPPGSLRSVWPVKVFLDLTDLSGASLRKDLKESCERSKRMVVVCGEDTYRSRK